MKYIWKVNMIDGKSFLVYSSAKNMEEFMKATLPQTVGGETISSFDCVNSYEENGVKCNAVVVIGSKISSVEFSNR